MILNRALTRENKTEYVMTNVKSQALNSEPKLWDQVPSNLFTFFLHNSKISWFTLLAFLPSSLITTFRVMPAKKLTTDPLDFCGEENRME